MNAGAKSVRGLAALQQPLMYSPSLGTSSYGKTETTSKRLSYPLPSIMDSELKVTILRSRKPTALSAPLYVENLMTWIQNQLDDEKLFPQKIGTSVLFSYSH